MLLYSGYMTNWLPWISITLPYHDDTVVLDLKTCFGDTWYNRSISELTSDIDVAIIKW